MENWMIPKTAPDENTLVWFPIKGDNYHHANGGVFAVEAVPCPDGFCAVEHTRNGQVHYVPLSTHRYATDTMIVAARHCGWQVNQ